MISTFLFLFFLFSAVVAVAVEQQQREGDKTDLVVVFCGDNPLCAKADFDEREVEVNIIIIILLRVNMARKSTDEFSGC
jgi:hypothetical protein